MLYANIKTRGCIGCGFCSQICPAVFQVNDCAAAAVITHPIPPEEEARAITARNDCPTHVISIDSTHMT